jgi:hypothetical protein
MGVTTGREDPHGKLETLEGGFLMALCTYCDNEMKNKVSCIPDSISLGGEFFEPIRWGDKRFSHGYLVDFPCRDCGTPPGGVHHFGCCVETCPACFGQRMGCVCTYPDDDPYGDEDEDDEYDEDELAPAAEATIWMAAALRAASPGASDDHWRTHSRCTAHLAPRHYRT